MSPFFSGRILVGASIAAFIGVASYMAGPTFAPKADITLEPHSGSVLVGETVTLNVMVTANVPVNVFGGEILFDPALLTVASINYNTSIADLWAEEPWYSNGDGSLNFIGGTTKPGGFIGNGFLLSITFETVGEGDAAVAIKEARVLQHDGLGSAVSVATPIDSVYSIRGESTTTETIVAKNDIGGTVRVRTQPPTTDLNADGRQTFTDLSIFMTHLASQNIRSDFNQDGRVSMADMSIILEAE